MNDGMEIPEVTATTLCACGCGEQTTVAKYADSRSGVARGERYRYVKGHGSYPRRSVAERFWSKVDKAGDCWLWTAFNLRGYGKFSPTGFGTVMAHRWAYQELVGPIPDGLQLDHLCRVTLCVNPAHLEPVTPRENTLRSNGIPAINARKTHCQAGHEYDEANTYHRKNGKGRSCRACHNARTRERTRRKREDRLTT